MGEEDAVHAPYGPGRLKPGQLLDHSLKRKMFCDVCELELIGSPMQKRHKECAKEIEPKLRHSKYVKSLMRAPAIEVPSNWIFKETAVDGRRATFECTAMDGAFAVGMLRYGEGWKPREKRISRARLFEGWERVSSVST